MNSMTGFGKAEVANRIAASLIDHRFVIADNRPWLDIHGVARAVTHHDHGYAANTDDIGCKQIADEVALPGDVLAVDRYDLITALETRVDKGALFRDV